MSINIDKSVYAKLDGNHQGVGILSLYLDQITDSSLLWDGNFAANIAVLFGLRILDQDDGVVRFT
jgi:hypothetical protein